MEMELATWVQIWDVAVCILYNGNTLDKGKNPSAFTTAIGKKLSKLGSLALGR